MTSQRLFITGATGCVGHYLLERLTKTTSHSMDLLVRTPKKLPKAVLKNPLISVHQGSLDAIEQHADIIKQCNTLIHIATAWHDDAYATKINVDKTMQLMDIASDGVCQKIIYFSTASILNNDNTPNPLALELGPMYVKSKYEAHARIQKATHLPPVYTVFPTLVMGGNNTIPYSHISEGLKQHNRFISLLRFFSLNGSFHFIHCQDIAEMVLHLLETNETQLEFVLGQPSLTAKQAIKELTLAYKKRAVPQIPLNTKVLLSIAKLLRIKIDPWGRYCAEKANMTHQVVNPTQFGRTNHFPTLTHAVDDIPRS